jgi:hypothetical protein
VPGKPPSKINERINLLTLFLSHVRTWREQEGWKRIASKPSADHVRVFMNKDMIAVRHALEDVGLLGPYRVRPTDGPVEDMDLFGPSMFTTTGAHGLDLVIDTLEQAIGVYAHLRDGTGLVPAGDNDTLSLRGALERAVRPFFGREAPVSEKALRDVVEVVLNALAVRFSREKEGVVVGQRTFIPDFVLPDSDLAVEVKYCRESTTAKQVREEIAADFGAYRTRWKHALALVYDCGQIQDGAAFARDAALHFGASIVIVRH